MKSVALTPAPFSFRGLLLIGALAAPILLWPRASFAYLPAPLSPVYLNTSYDPMYGCGYPYYYIDSGPANSCAQFVGYAYTTQVDGTSPVYLNTTVDEYNTCSYGYHYLAATPANSCAQFMGYFNTAQVSGTSPIYLTTSYDDYNYQCGTSYYYITTSSGSCSQFIGYAYLTLPPPVNFTVFPKFFIGSVIYVPPGQGASSISYGTGTVIGSTVSTTDSWSKSSTMGQGLTFGIASITFGDNFGGQTTHSVDMQETISQNATYKAPPSDFVNHDYDLVQIFLGVNVNASVDYLGNVTWGLDFSQVLNRGFAETGYNIAVGCLRPNSTVPASECVSTLNFLDSVGITSADYPSILGADPFADPNASQAPNPDRYVPIDSVAYFPSPTVVTYPYNETNNTTTTNQVTTSYGYSVGAGVSVTGDVGLKFGDTFTFTHSSTTSNRTGSTTSSAFTLSMPSYTYNGPQTLFVYLDTVFKTFMFSVHPPACTPTSCAAQGKNCGSVADGCGSTLSCGSCSGYQTCGGGGVANLCGCTPTTCAAQGKNCGSIADGCGGTLTCGTCSAYQTCGGGGTANVCGCTPYTASQVCGACGTYAADGCGGSVWCGACPPPSGCRSGYKDCGDGTCVPKTTYCP